MDAGVKQDKVPVAVQLQDAGFAQKTLVEVQAYNGLEHLLQLEKQNDVWPSRINFTKFEKMVKTGVTCEQFTSELHKQYVTD